MENTNAIFQELVDAISPVVSIGAGSAICTVCLRLRINPDQLTRADLPALIDGLTKHYERFWAHKMVFIRSALERLRTGSSAMMASS